MSQYHFDPDSYLRQMRAEVPAYDQLQALLAGQTAACPVTRFLDLGTGTGETARAVLQMHPQARMVGVDASADMLAVAASTLPTRQVEALRVADLADALPPGSFDLVVSALAVHHLDAEGKQLLFQRIRAALRPGGLFVMADVIVPEDPADAVTPLSPGYDRPERLPALLTWLEEAGLPAEVVWRRQDIALLVARAGGDS